MQLVQLLTVQLSELTVAALQPVVLGLVGSNSLLQEQTLHKTEGGGHSAPTLHRGTTAAAHARHCRMTLQQAC